MRRLHIDFGPTAGRPPRLMAWLLLALALTLAAWEARHLYQAWRERGPLRQQVAQLQIARDAASQPAPSEAQAQSTPARHAAMVQAAARLQAPWSALLGGIESAGDAQVVLLALAPDAETGEVRIQVEAKDMQALLAYALRLTELPTLSGAHLESHQIQTQHPQRPVQGAIVARWRVPQPEAPQPAPGVRQAVP